MKPVQLVLAATAALFVAACGSDAPANGGGGGGEKCEADSTFAQVQQQIFDGQGCTASTCHGDAMLGGLDLRPDAAYESLINVAASSGEIVRVFPGEQDLSALYLKVAAKTEGFDLSTVGISGGTMPTGDGALSENDLSLLRAWIRGGAPETGIVKGTEDFSTCDLVGEVVPTAMPPMDDKESLYTGAVDASLVRPPVPPHERVPSIHPLLSKQILDCVRLHPDDRPASMSVVANRLELILELLENPGKPPPPIVGDDDTIFA